MTVLNYSPTRGFSLIELLVVVSIIAILAAVAYPSYQDQLAAARRSDMQAELMRLPQFMERVYTETGCYNPGDDNDCSSGKEAAPDIATTSDFYSVSFAAGPTANSFTLQATPKAGGPQATDGIMQIDELGRRFWDQNNNGDVSDEGEDDWVKN